MANIALICEGVSEHKIISHIVGRYCDGHTINPIQPKILNGKQDGYGGWEQVLGHCNEKTFAEAFQYNDYLIVQIDTDASYQKSYGVPPAHPDGSPKSDARFHAEIKARLLRNIPRAMRSALSDKIIFVICKNEIECWLLPLFYSGGQACRTNNCIFHLNQALAKKGLQGIPKKGKNCDEASKAYQALLRKGFRRKDDIAACASHSYGFGEFLKGLDCV